MSDLTDNWFYPSAAWITLRSGPVIDLQKTPILAKKKKIIFSAEAHFDLGGYVNKQNCCIWGTENPHAYIEKPTHPKRVTVWCGFWFLPSAEWIWLCIRLNNAEKWACHRLTEDANFGKKNRLFSWSSLWSWRVCKQAKLSHLGQRKPRTHTLKRRHTKTNHCLEDFGPEA